MHNAYLHASHYDYPPPAWLRSKMTTEEIKQEFPDYRDGGFFADWATGTAEWRTNFHGDILSPVRPRTAEIPRPPPTLRDVNNLMDGHYCEEFAPHWKEGDEFWRWHDDAVEERVPLAGLGGVALVRGGRVIAYMTTFVC